MAFPYLKRKDNGKILSDICPSWSGWVTPFGLAEIPTTIGVPYLQKTGVMTVRCTATFRFRGNDARHSIDNYFEAMSYAMDLGVFEFRDLEGYVSDVQVSKAPTESDSFAVSSSRIETVYEVPFSLLRKGYVGSV